MDYKELLGKEWAELLKDYLASGDLGKIATQIKKERLSGVNVLPPEGSDMFFKIFKLLQPDRIKVIWINQDPYPQDKPLVMTGIALDCSNTTIVQPSLANVINEIEREYPQKLNLDRSNLKYLVDQGVFLVNTALSVIENKPGSHAKLWANFTTNWIKALQTYNDKVWLLAGREAQSYKKLITNPSHFILETSHPSPLGATKEAPIAFLGSDCFKILNEQISARNRNPINW